MREKERIAEAAKERNHDRDHSSQEPYKNLVFCWKLCIIIINKRFIIKEQIAQQNKKSGNKNEKQKCREALSQWQRQSNSI